MKIIQAHKFYWHRDGASNYALFLADLLEGRGHEAIPFAMEHEKNLPSPYEKYFVSKIDLSDPKQVSFFNKLKYACRLAYSGEAKRKMQALLRAEKIEVVHLHNIYHHISPSILPVIKKQGIPIVMTVHDYKLICPNYTMFHHGKVHEEDCRGWYGTCVKNKCMKNSRLQSRIVRAEMIFHHKIMKYYERLVDKFIAPSEFILKKCVEHGWAEEKFIHLPNPIDLKRFELTTKDKGYVAFVGRLSEEKGVETLIEAAKLTPQIEYKIAGEGPLSAKLQLLINNYQLSNVSLCGFQTGKALDDFIDQARILVVPSLWYENYPLSVLEGKAKGKIVLASNIGGLPELLMDKFLFPARDHQALAELIENWFNKNLAERKQVGEELRLEVERENDPGEHVKKILGVYEGVFSKNK